MASWERRLAELLGSSAGTKGPWSRRFAQGVGSIGSSSISLGTKGSWYRRVVQGASPPLSDDPFPSSWERGMGGDGPTGSWVRRLVQGSRAISGGPGSNWILVTGFWNDSGEWDDSAVWMD